MSTLTVACSPFADGIARKIVRWIEDLATFGSGSSRFGFSLRCKLTVLFQIEMQGWNVFESTADIPEDEISNSRRLFCKNQFSLFIWIFQIKFRGAGRRNDRQLWQKHLENKRAGSDLRKVEYRWTLQANGQTDDKFDRRAISGHGMIHSF